MEKMDLDYQEEEGRQEGVSGGFLSEFLSKPRYLAVIAFIAGVVFGWIVLGWWAWPVEWENASVQELRPDLQEDYMRMVIDSYNLRTNMDIALGRINEFGDGAQQVLDKVAQNPGDETSQAILNFFQQSYSAGGGIDTDTTTGEPTQPDSGGGSFPLWVCVVPLVLAGGLVVVYFFQRTRRRKPVKKTAAMKAQEFSSQAEQTDYEALGTERPVSQYMTTYLIGDDLYDDSFSIDSLSGEFMGECGVGIADIIGVGEPKRVTAFEVWLFDKNDIQTVTKVLMSNHIYHDEVGHNRLAAKGEPVLANPGAEVILETETLQMVVRIMDMAYGGGALPENSFFDRITLELAVWSKR